MVKFDNFERRLIKKGIDIDYPAALAAVIFQGYLGEMNNKKYSLDYDASDYLFNDIFSRIFWLLEQREIAADRDVSVPEALAAFMGYAKVLSCTQESLLYIIQISLNTNSIGLVWIISMWR